MQRFSIDVQPARVLWTLAQVIVGAILGLRIVIQYVNLEEDRDYVKELSTGRRKPRRIKEKHLVYTSFYLTRHNYLRILIPDDGHYVRGAYVPESFRVNHEYEHLVWHDCLVNVKTQKMIALRRNTLPAKREFIASILLDDIAGIIIDYVWPRISLHDDIWTL